MRRLLQLVIGLLACLASASALPGLFPRDKTTTYIYSADVKTGTIEPAPYASQFVINGYMHVTPVVQNPNLKNAYFIRLNVTHGIRNGEIQHFEGIVDTFPMPDAAKVLNDPFVINVGDNGRVESMMFDEDEPGWSLNMKRAMGSMLQLDLSSMDMVTPMKPHAFITKENTIYGECAVTYGVNGSPDLGEDRFTVTKMMEPMSCDRFNQHTFNSKEFKPCMVESEEEMSTASQRIFHIKYTGEDLLIESLVAHGVVNYFPWKAKSEAHYILANQSMVIDSTMPVGSMNFPEVNMTRMVTTSDLAFQKSKSHYAINAGFDDTNGRHVVDQEAQIVQMMEMLGEGVDYMNENQLVMTSPDLKHGQTMNRMMHTMTRMDIPSLEQVFNNIADGTSAKEVTMMNLFLNMIPYVGTNATCLFTRNIIRKHKIEDHLAIIMLSKLPFNIRHPTDYLLREMEDIMKLGNDTSLGVRKAGILCFATMIYKTHVHDSFFRTMHQEKVKEYVQHYFDHVMEEPTYEMKMVYLHGMRNIEIGNVHQPLGPMIRGEVKVSDRPDHLRLHSLLVDWRRNRDLEYIWDTYWSIFTNRAAPMAIRLSAYAVLFEQPPRMDRLMSLYWWMTAEENEHVYNYYYTAMKSIANSVDPCMAPMREMVRKILRFTRVRPVSGIMTGVWLVDYQNNEYGFGDAATLFSAADEHTGIPFAVLLEFASTDSRRPVSDLMIWMRVEGDDRVQNMMWKTAMAKPDIPIDEIKDVLEKASEDMPPRKKPHIEFTVIYQGRTVAVEYIDKMPEASGMMAIVQMMTDMKLNNWQWVTFDELYTMQVPTDVGLPALLHNSIPRVISVKANNQMTSSTPPLFGMKLETVIKDWRYGDYSIEVYNPVANSWHSIRRALSYDSSLPTAMSVGFNVETKSLKLNFPRLPISQYSITGIRSYAKNYVMVKADDGVLERYCPSCSQTVPVTRGPQHRKNTTILNYDSKDFGLLFTKYQYDCERMTPLKSRYEMYAQIMNKDFKNTWGDNGILSLMVAREEYRRMTISPEPGSCGFIAKMEPSTVYPASEIDMNMRMSVEVPIAKANSLIPASKINFRGTLETRAVDSNVSVQSWAMNVNTAFSQGFVDNRVQVQLTRTTPGEKDLKICIDGYKIYPRIEPDPLIRDSKVDQEIMGKVTMTMGETENGTCVPDGMSIQISAKAEMSEEQKEALKHEMVNGMCQKDVENPDYFYNETSIVPRTLACMNETMLRTFMRTTSHTISYKNIPAGMIPALNWIADEWRRNKMIDVNYSPAHTDQGTIKFIVDYPLNDESMNLIVRTPTHEEKYTGLVEKSYDRLELTVLENTRFSRNFVEDMQNKEMKFCVVYPGKLLNTDGALMSFDFPSKWTLVTGDHMGHMFSVFVKRFESKKLGLLMTVSNHTLEVNPSATTGPVVTVDQNVIDHVNGVTVGDNSSYDMRTSWDDGRLVIQSSHTSFELEWTERSVALAMRTNLRGRVTGLCGHLDGTHADRMARVYSFGQ